MLAIPVDPLLLKFSLEGEKNLLLREAMAKDQIFLKLFQKVLNFLKFKLIIIWCTGKHTRKAQSSTDHFALIFYTSFTAQTTLTLSLILHLTKHPVFIHSC